MTKRKVLKNLAKYRCVKLLCFLVAQRDGSLKGCLYTSKFPVILREGPCFSWAWPIEATEAKRARAEIASCEKVRHAGDNLALACVFRSTVP